MYFAFSPATMCLDGLVTSGIGANFPFGLSFLPPSCVPRHSESMATGTFVEFQTRSILQFASTSTDRKLQAPHTSPRASRLQSLAAQFNSPLQGSDLDKSIASLLKELDENECIDEVEEAIEWETLSRSVVAVYTEAMRLMLQEAIQADDEAEWWQRVEQVGGGTAWYLLQSERVFHSSKPRN
jgi:hypothetical protein